MSAQSPAEVAAPTSSNFWELVRQKKWRQSLERIQTGLSNVPIVRFFLSSVSARLTALMTLATAVMMVILIVSVTTH
ncbi:MAG: hypothetical protein ACLR7M_08325, partial [Varibaculum timonense]